MRTRCSTAIPLAVLALAVSSGDAWTQAADRYALADSMIAPHERRNRLD
jgi:hypothetical protein